MNTVSIIIAHNPQRDTPLLPRLLQELKRQGQENVLVETRGNRSAARNLAAHNASGNVLVFFDDDIFPRENCIHELMKPFDNPDVGLVGGVNINFSHIGFREKVASALWASSLAMGKSSARYTPRGDIRDTDESELISCVMAIRRDVFMATGGFPEHIIPCEENVLINRIQRLGYRTLYNPFAVVYHRRPRIMSEYIHTMYSYGLGRGRMLRSRDGGSAGGLKMLWYPNWTWPIYGTMFLLHYASYVSGLVRGYLE